MYREIFSNDINFIYNKDLFKNFKDVSPPGSAGADRRWQFNRGNGLFALNSDVAIRHEISPDPATGEPNCHVFDPKENPNDQCPDSPTTAPIVTEFANVRNDNPVN